MVNLVSDLTELLLDPIEDPGVSDSVPSSEPSKELVKALFLTRIFVAKEQFKVRCPPFSPPPTPQK